MEKKVKIGDIVCVSYRDTFIVLDVTKINKNKSIKVKMDKIYNNIDCYSKSSFILQYDEFLTIEEYAKGYSFENIKSHPKIN